MQLSLFLFLFLSLSRSLSPLSLGRARALLVALGSSTGFDEFRIQYVTAEWEPAFLRQAREFPFFPLLPREASK